MQRDRRKRYSPARHPVLLRRVLLVLCILAVLWLGYSCMMPQLLFSARGTMIFMPAAAGVARRFRMRAAFALRIFSGRIFIFSGFRNACGRF